MTEVSAADIKFQFNNLRHDFCLEETEDSWEKISKSMQTFISVAEKGGYECASTEVVDALRSFHRPITNAMNSERTRLCGTALDMLTSVANGLGHDFEQLIPLFMPSLLNICSRTNKVVTNRARGAILGIIESTQLASILSFFVQSVKDKAASLRLVVAEGTLACLNSCNPPDLEKEARARDIETIIRGTARDANPDVRKVSRKIFDSYKILLPSRVESFTAPLSPTMKKYLDIKTTARSLMSSKSTSNLREHPKAPEANLVAVKVRGHMRTASASTTAVTTATQSKNLAAKLTRVVRKERPPGPPVQPSTMPPKTESEKTNLLRPASSTSTTAGTASGPIRTVPHNAYLTSAAGHSRNHPIATSQTLPIAATATATSTTASTVAPRRLQVTSDTKSSAAVQQTSAATGPRRVPMPPPAPKKEQDGQKRPPSRVESAASINEAGKIGSTSQAHPPAPIKKAATIAVRAPITKPPVPKFRPTNNANSTTTPSVPTAPTSLTGAVKPTKPLVINKAKPIWGRAAPPTKSTTSATHKPPARSVVKKPSSLISKPSITTTATSAKRPMTPAMVVLPPSPARGEPKTEDKEMESDESTRVSHEDVGPHADSMLPESGSLRPGVNTITEDEDADKTIQHDTQSRTSVSVSPADSRLSTPTSDGSGPVMHIGSAELPSIRNPDVFGDDQAIPHTPENILLTKPHQAETLSEKTPISALLSSIERGFLYSPTTPLSPADSYLPGPNGTVAYRHETHAPRVEGPMQPFNHALHVMNPGEVIFGKIGPVREADGNGVSMTGV